MRMKAVCEATGLTDRAVRYYISEGLIDPDYTENYTGRRTYDFSEADIRQLNDIAVLRKFGFTVAEIRTMLQAPEQIDATVQALRQRKRLEIDEEQALLQALERLTDPCGNVAELALALCAPVQTALVPVEDSRIPIGEFFPQLLVALLRGWVAWRPVVLSASLMILSWGNYEYGSFRPTAFAFLTVFLVPSIMILNWHRLQERFGWQKQVKRFLWVLCVLSFLPCAISSYGTFSHSETTNIRNYRILDGRCLINRSAFFNAFFPQWARHSDVVKNENGNWVTVDLDARYYYRFLEFMDYTYDVYAEWPLEPKAFDEEVARVRALFGDPANLNQNECCLETEKGPWTCLVIHERAQEPFAEVTDSYGYWIFAYDPQTLRVRYICCESLENGADQPYYLQLDWE